MAKMLGNTPHGRYSTCNCRVLCRRTSAEDHAYRRAQRSRERAELREETAAELLELR